MTIHNLHHLPESAAQNFGADSLTQLLGNLAGTQNFYVNIDILPPGASSAKFHSHTLQEEFFMILQGAGTLRTASGVVEVREGDFFAKPAGLANPHSFTNTGKVSLHILDIGTRQAGDIAYYPDENTYLLRDEKLPLEGDSIPGWTSEPD